MNGTQLDNEFKGPLYFELKERLQTHENLEDKLDEMRRFKQEKVDHIKKSIPGDSFDLDRVMSDLTDVADSLLIGTYDIAVEAVRKIYGLPRFKDNDGNFLPGEFAFIGMGKLGGRELHFSSDLDMIFVFNRNGETHGGRQCSNREFYAKVAQRMISNLSLYTRFGYAYKVDAELRPSGKAGALVTALDPWITYYHENAALWEKQALLRARLIYATGDFTAEFTGLFKRLTFLTPFPEDIGNEINRLRMRIEKELANESDTRWNFKKGYGGLIDIEFSVQYLQLKMGKIFEDILLTHTRHAVEAISKHSILNKEIVKSLLDGYDFYRRMEMQLELQFNLREGYLDIRANFVSSLADHMGFSDRDSFIERFDRIRHEVRNIYLSVLKIEDR